MLHNFYTKRIRSFVLRKGRITKNQKTSLKKYWKNMGINYVKEKINFEKIFNRKTKTILEIGFGMGNSLVNIAKNNQQNNFIGIEVYAPGIGSCMNYAQNIGINNLRIICHDAVEVLENMIFNSSLDIIQLFFPDPWHKKKHNKRRIIQFEFIILVLKKLKQGGIFHIATDSQEYYKHILNVTKNILNFKNISEEKIYVDIINSRIKTKFELRGINLGNKISDLIFKKML